MNKSAVATSGHWVQMPLLSPEQKKAGTFPGGEGGQWHRGALAASPADPDFLLLPIDVGGVYRSLDAGKHWAIAMVGWNARGANGFAIDPKNADRVVGIAANSMNWDMTWGASPNGLYLSTNKAGSWKQVLPTVEAFDGVVAFDPTSFEAEKGYCTRVYYLSSDHGMFWSTDGGETWAALAGAPTVTHLAGGEYGLGLITRTMMDVDMATGTVYVAGQNGIFRCKAGRGGKSPDAAENWEQIEKEAAYGFCVAANGWLYYSDPTVIHISKDAGETWGTLAAAGIVLPAEQRIQGIAVSPANRQRILCWTSGKGFEWTRYVSHDGGATFAKVVVNKEIDTLPTNAREAYFRWDFKNPDVAYSMGGDWVMKSKDGGKTFAWSNNGDNGIMLGGSFALNARHPNLVFLGFQDYNGAFTTDGGATWHYQDVSGLGWGGFEYNAVALNPQVMWVGDAPGWGGPRRLRITRDGGQTWAFVNGEDGKPLEFGKVDASAIDPRDANVGFAGALRTRDGGKTWARMAGCDGVFTANVKGERLYGVSENVVVVSGDHGVTWRKVADSPGKVSDLAVSGSAEGTVIYAAADGVLKRWQGGMWAMMKTPGDQFGRSRIVTVAVDPVDEKLVYAGGPANTYATSATVVQSKDAGDTWENLTRETPLKPGENSGPHEVSWLRVHPVTREVWVAGQCFGLWRWVTVGK